MSHHVEESLSDDSVEESVKPQESPTTSSHGGTPNINQQRAMEWQQLLVDSERPSRLPSASATPRTPATTTTPAPPVVPSAHDGAGGAEATDSAPPQPANNCPRRVLESDVLRSLWELYHDDQERDAKRAELLQLLSSVLEENPERHYYQGLHELMGYVMYVVGPALTPTELRELCSNLLNTRWARFSERTLRPSEAMLVSMHRIIAAERPSFAKLLEDCGVAPSSHYACAWFLTWYVHNVGSSNTLSALFDYFIAAPDDFAVVFFTAAFVLHHEQDIVAFVEEQRRSSIDACELMPQVHSRMSRLPEEYLKTMKPADLHELLAHADDLRQKYADVVSEAYRQFLEPPPPATRTEKIVAVARWILTWLREHRWKIGGAAVVLVMAVALRRRLL